MNDNLEKQIKNIQTRAIIDLTVNLLMVFSFIIAISLLFIPSFVSAIFFLIAGVFVFYLIYRNKKSNLESNQNMYKPILFTRKKNFTFEELVSCFENFADKSNQISESDDVRFFKFSKGLKLRALLYKTTDFDKSAFDNAKKRINKKANKQLKISQWVSRTEAVKMMRLNIVYAEKLSDSLIQLVKRNASRTLSRVEGVMNIAIVHNQIIIPPIYGNCSLIEIGRYKKIIKLVNELILNKEVE